MKMISSTSITSAIGVTLMSALTPPLVLLVDMATARGHLCREVLRESRTAELVPHTLDQVVDQCLRGVRHLDDQELELRLEEVEQPHRRNGDDQTEGRGDQRLRDTARHRRQAARAAAGRHAGEGV